MTCITRLARVALLGFLCIAAACGSSGDGVASAPTPADRPSDDTTAPADGGSADGATARNDAADATLPVAKGNPGTLDVSFGTGGVFDFSSFGKGEIDHVLERAGGYVFAGTTHDSAGDSLQLGGVTTAGALDTGFGAGGRTIVRVGADLRFDRAHQLVAVPGAGWLVAGKVQDQAALVRFGASGALLTAFGTGGVASVQTASGGESFGALRLADGSFVAVVKRDITLGTFEYDLRAFSATGATLDARSKISASFFSSTFEARNGGLWVLAGVPAARSNGSQSFAARYSPPGAFAIFSASPNPDYPSVTPTDGIFAGAYKSISTVIDGGKTLVLSIAGTGNTDHLVRVDAGTGALDTAYGAAGKVALSFPTATLRILLAVDEAGRAIVALRDNTSFVTTLVRFDAAGQRDLSFGGTGQLTIPFSVTCARIDPAGRLIVAGAKVTNTPGGSDTAMRIARVNL